MDKNSCGEKRQVELLVMSLRELELNHAPDGYPAVRMKDISDLCDAVQKNKPNKKDIELIARIVCVDRGYDPDELEPGNRPRVDGVCHNGDRGHFMWREFATLARKIVKALAS